MNSATNPPTTPQERHVRLAHLARHGDEGAVQALLELGSRVALATELEPELTGLLEEFGEADEATVDLAAKIAAPVRAGAPEFEIGDEVARDGEPVGKVVERYIDEHGDQWEYQVRSRRYGTNPYSEHELSAAG